MIALEKARRLIREAPDSPSAHALQQLISGLESGHPVQMQAIYEIDYAHFMVCLEIIEGWRLHRYGRSFRKVQREGAAAFLVLEGPAQGSSRAALN